ncbi:n- gnat protein [Lasius niger]|uniref:N-gnat protein n=1 Tax=Lasius niger TaxID=67767 RepID=A0A0J7KDB5_LASNI|nr:n- gnat protein [Lasius niger]
MPPKLEPTLTPLTPPYMLKTTKPKARSLHPYEPLPEPIITDRLILRLFNEWDMGPYHTLARQPEAMDSDGGYSVSFQFTKDRFLPLLPTNTSFFYFGIFLKGDSEGDLIGSGGIYDKASTETGWPRLEFKFKKEYWGQGYATEFTTAFLEFWWKLPRQKTMVIINESLVDPQNTSGYTPELLYAWTKPENLEAQKVLQKVGFEYLDGLNNGLLNWQLRNPSSFE